MDSGIEGDGAELNFDVDDAIEDSIRGNSISKETLSQSSSAVSLDSIDQKPQSKIRGRISKLSTGVNSVKIDSNALRQIISSTYQGIKSSKLPRGPSFRSGGGVRRVGASNQNDTESNSKSGDQRIKYVRKGCKLEPQDISSKIDNEIVGTFKNFTVNVICCKSVFVRLMVLTKARH